MVGDPKPQRLAELFKRRFYSGNLCEVDNSFTTKAYRMMVVSSEYLTQLDLVFPTDWDTLHNIELLKQIDGAVDACTIAGRSNAGSEFGHSHTLMHR